jgi:hypothetical protein
MKKMLSEQKDRLYSGALKYWYSSLYINFGTLLFLLLSVYINSSPLALLFGSIILISPIALVVCRIVFEAKFREADRCKRLLHYIDSLGIDIPQAEAACLLGHSAGKPVGISYDEPYYVSPSDQGIKRLVENTRESAFFTFKLAGYTKRYSLGAIIFMLLLVFLIIQKIITSPEDSKNIVNYTKSAAGIMSFFFTGDIIVICLKWWGMEKEAEMSYHTLDWLSNRGNRSIDQAMRAVEEYHITVVQAVPIPVWIYLRHRDSLNNASQKAHGVKDID